MPQLQMTVLALCSVFVAMTVSPTRLNAAALKVADLRCEYKTNPLGIDVAKPRLSWVLQSTDPAARGDAQTGYQILVASSREELDADKGDLWDTGEVKSDETIQIVYGGAALKSGQPCWWKVRVWDQSGERSQWSEPAMWSAGLLTPGDWQAKWIGYDEPEAKMSAASSPSDSINLEKLQWVWTDEGDAAKKVPAGTRYFAKKITLPAGNIRKAIFLLTCDDKFLLRLNGKPAGEANGHTQAHEKDVTKFLKPGENLIGVEGTNTGENPAALVGRLAVWSEGAPEPVIVDIDKTWKVSIEKPAKWEDGSLDLSAMKDVKEWAPVGTAPWGMPGRHKLELPPPPYMRKSFTADKPVKRATAYATALGLYELRLNGERVGDVELAPGWTDYKKRVYYQTYDVTKQIKQGENAVAAILGDGWYCGYYSYQGRRALYGIDPRLRVQLNIEFEDGTAQIVGTDESWTCAYGPQREADLLMGSAYDARKRNPGWDKPSFDDSNWKPALMPSEQPKVPVQAHPGNPVRRHERIAAKAITEPKPGVYIFDLGQNMVGWVHLKLTDQKPGTKITLRHMEMLNPDGTLYLTSLRGARAQDEYIARGGGEENWEPRFTFHGFRYVEVTGLSAKPSLDAISGVVVHSDMPRTGEFECSNKLVNQLQHNIIWGQKGNYLEIPTDCPQRDERLGWTGDAQFFIRTGAYNFDVSAFFTKWLVDLDQDSQFPDGSFADVAPDLLGGHGNVAWGDAGIICPYTIYRVYGDKRIIEQHYDAMARYIEYLHKTSKDFIRGQGAYGDWLNLGGGAKSEVIGTAYFEHVTRRMSEMAAAIGKEDDAKKYAQLANKVRDAFIKAFVTPDGGIKESSQTGYALAFTMDLLPHDVRAKAAERFVEEIKKKDWHLGTGFIGTPRLLPALTVAGKTDVAYRLFLTDTFPSWLFQVTLGATTMWERWDGWTPEKGFQDPGMNSFNHYAFGSVGEWMYRTVGGIDSDGVGFKKIILKPQPGEGLEFARAKYRSIRGDIASEWKREGDALHVKFTVPPNTTATAYVPAKDAAKVTEGGHAIAKAKGVKFQSAENGVAVYHLKSGNYDFAVKD
jgi:alpha-L-rhamnosidase